MKRLVKIILVLCLAHPGPLLATQLQINTANQQLHEHVQDIFHTNRTRLEQLSGAFPELIIIEIPPDLPAYHQRLRQLGAPLWAAGIAMQNHIILRSPRVQGGSLNFTQVMLHELSHVYMNRALEGRRAPWWLHEGLAMLAARQNPGHITMASAVFNESLLPWLHMGEDFFPKPSQVDLAYVQAFYMTAFLEEQGLLQPLIRGLGQGHDLNRSLYDASGKPLSYWEDEFRQQMSSRFSWMALGAGSAFWGVVGVAAAVIVVWRRQVMLRQMRAMPEPDGVLRQRPVIRARLPRRRVKIVCRPQSKQPLPNRDYQQ